MKTTVTRDGKVHLANKRWFWLREIQAHKIKHGPRQGQEHYQPFPVACIASELDEYPDGKQVRFSIAIHNPLDTFDDLRGHNIALARLEQGKLQGIVNRLGAKTEILNIIAQDKNLPIRVRNAASQWLHSKRQDGPH